MSKFSLHPTYKNFRHCFSCLMKGQDLFNNVHQSSFLTYPAFKISLEFKKKIHRSIPVINVIDKTNREEGSSLAYGGLLNADR